MNDRPITTKKHGYIPMTACASHAESPVCPMIYSGMITVTSVRLEVKPFCFQSSSLKRTGSLIRQRMGTRSLREGRAEADAPRPVDHRRVELAPERADYPPEYHRARFVDTEPMTTTPSTPALRIESG